MNDRVALVLSLWAEQRGHFHCLGTIRLPEVPLGSKLDLHPHLYPFLW